MMDEAWQKEDRRWAEVDGRHESIEGIDRGDGLGP